MGLVCRIKAPGGSFRNLKFDLLLIINTYILTRLASSRTANSCAKQAANGTSEFKFASKTAFLRCL